MDADHHMRLDGRGQRADQGRRLADPVGQQGAVEIASLPELAVFEIAIY